MCWTTDPGEFESIASGEVDSPSSRWSHVTCHSSLLSKRENEPPRHIAVGQPVPPVAAVAKAMVAVTAVCPVAIVVVADPGRVIAAVESQTEVGVEEDLHARAERSGPFVFAGRLDAGDRGREPRHAASD